MQLNAEWGIECQDNGIVESLVEAVENEKRIILEPEAIKSEFEQLNASLPELPQQPPEGDVKPKWNRPSASGQVWLKPIGVTNNPIEEGRRFDLPEDDLHFSKTRPSGVKIGDLMLLYGIGATRFLGVFEVLDEPRKSTEAEMLISPWRKRWPWSVTGKNLSPHFGAYWATQNLWASEQVEEFLQQNSGGTITANGGDSLGALNYGQDKLRLSSEFASFVLGKIFSFEESKA